MLKKCLSLLLVVAMTLSMVYFAPATKAASPSDYIQSTYASHLRVRTIQEVDLWDCPTDASNLVCTVPENTVLTVKAIHANIYNYYYYEVLYYGKTVYCRAAFTTPVDHLVGDVTVSDVQAPASLKKGSSFSIKGSITSTYNSLSKVTVSIYQGTSIVGIPYMTVSATPSGKSYSLYNSTIDNNMKFGSLPAGVYTYVIFAEATSKFYDNESYFSSYTKKVILETQRCIVTDYSNPNTALGTGVNVSSTDGSVSWSKAAGAIDFATLEIGQGTTIDSKFYTNVKGCVNYDIPYGIMLYAKATTAAEATAEATFVTDILIEKGYHPEMPIWYNVEDTAFSSMTAATRLAVIKAFCDGIKAAGFQPGLFTYISMWRNSLTDEYYSSLPKWVAQIDGFTDAGTSTYDGGLWQHQYSWEGEVDGFTNAVDMNYCYFPYSGNSGDATYVASCTYFPSHANGKTKSSTTMRQYPRSDYDSVTSLSSGTSLEIVGVYRNPLGEYWYRVIKGTSTGYVPASSVTVSEFLYNDFGVVNPVMASNLTKGKNYDLSGTVVSQHNNISTLTAKVYSGEATTGALLTATTSPNTKSYNLALNTDEFSLDFKTLDKGYYTYELSVTVNNYYINNNALTSDSSTMVLWVAPFTVGGYTITLPDTGVCNHTMVSDAAVAATCTKSGLSAGSHCSLCDYVETAQATIPALGHDWSGSVCTRCSVVCGHDFSDGFCTVCGTAEPISDYYLFGYINGANYACEEDADNIGTYLFVNGKLTVTFTHASYVGVKSGNNAVWFMTNGWLGEDVTSATLYDSSSLEDANKLYVPGNREITFTLTPNSDGSVTLSYTVASCDHNWSSGVCSNCGEACVHSYSDGACSVCGMPCTHRFTNSTCINCGYVCTHSWSNGKCSICNAYCTHSYANGKCSKCGYACKHSWSNGACTICKLSCSHSYTNGTCTICGNVCTHNYSGGICVSCGMAEPIKDYYLFGYINGANYACEEDAENIGTYKFNDGILTTIFTEASYVGVKSGDNEVWYMTNGWMGEEATSATLYNADNLGEEANKLHVPGNRAVTFTLTANADGTLTLSYTLAPCSHLYNNGVCTICGERCSHSWSNGTCSGCGLTCTHSYTNGVCTVCGYESPVVDYYLFGYINGADYACEDDAENLGIYKFVDGTLTATFTKNSYVAVKTDNDNWYMTYGWLGNTVTTVKLYNTDITGENSNKLYVPANRPITFTLVVNGDDTLTLSYVLADCTHSWSDGVCTICGEACEHTWSGGACTTCGKTVTIPTLTLKNYSVSFEGEVRYNIYYTVSDLGNVGLEDMGLLTWSTPQTNGTYANAADIIPGSKTDGTQYVVFSRGVAAKNLSDNLYFKIYAKLEDGTYVYTDLKSINAKNYATGRINNSTDPYMKALSVAMLNYGAAAQTYFGYKSYNLMNSGLTDAQKALIKAYDSSMVASSVTVSSTKAGIFAKKGFGTCTISASFDAAFVLNYYLNTTYVPDGDVTLYYWDLNTFNSVSVLTKANATGTMVTIPTGYENQYWGEVTGIAAKELDQTVFVAAVYTSGGVEYTTSVMNYSMGRYCVKLAGDDTSAQQELAQATAVYGYYAKQYFANLAAQS